MNNLKDIKIGVIGCGYWATNIIKSLEEENFKNVYVFDFEFRAIVPFSIGYTLFLCDYPNAV